MNELTGRGRGRTRPAPGTHTLWRQARWLWPLLVGLALLAARPAGAATIPHGPSFALDPSGPLQALPAVAAGASGAAVVVWQTFDGAGTGTDIVAQLRLPGGATRQFVVHEERAGDQVRPAVAMDASGAFAVAWEQPSASDKADVFVRFFGPDGEPLGVEQEASAELTSNDRTPDIAMSPDGHTIVVWSSEVRSGGQLGDTHWRLYAASFAPGGARTGGWRVGETMPGDQTAPRVAMAARDRYAVAWMYTPPQVNGAPPEANAAKVRLARATPAGIVEELVAPGQVGAQGDPAVAIDAAGTVAVAWGVASAAEGEVFARVFPADAPAGAPFQVNPEAAGAQRRPAVALGRQGELLVVWQDGAGGQAEQVLARAYGASGQPDGPPFPLPQSQDRRELLPRVALRPDGTGMAVWHSLPAGSSLPEVYGRRLGPPFARDPSPGPFPPPPTEHHRVMLPIVIGGGA